MKPPKKKIEFMVLNLKRWPVDLNRQLKIEAARRDMSKADIIEVAVREYLWR